MFKKLLTILFVFGLYSCHNEIEPNISIPTINKNEAIAQTINIRLGIENDLLLGLRDTGLIQNLQTSYVNLNNSEWYIDVALNESKPDNDKDFDVSRPILGIASLGLIPVDFSSKYTLNIALYHNGKFINRYKTSHTETNNGNLYSIPKLSRRKLTSNLFIKIFNEMKKDIDENNP